MSGIGDLPSTQWEFEQRFSTEAGCIEYLRRQRWPDGFRCPRCGGGRAWALRRRALDQCVSCGHQVSLTAGTVFHGTRKPLVLWFRVIGQFLVSKSGCSAVDVSRQHGLKYETAWTWLHKLRSCLSQFGRAPLDGSVEVDETYLGGEDDDSHKGRCLNWAQDAGRRCRRVARRSDRPHPSRRRAQRDGALALWLRPAERRRRLAGQDRRAAGLSPPAQARIPPRARRAGRQPEERRQAAAQRAPRLLAVAPLDARHLPGSLPPDPSAVVPRRVRVPLQSAPLCESLAALPALARARFHAAAHLRDTRGTTPTIRRGCLSEADTSSAMS